MSKESIGLKIGSILGALQKLIELNDNGIPEQIEAQVSSQLTAIDGLIWGTVDIATTDKKKGSK